MNVNIYKIKDFIFNIIPLCFSASPVLLRLIKGVKHLSSSEGALIEFTDEVKEILVGILLGDGFMVRIYIFKELMDTLIDLVKPFFIK